MPKSAPRTPMVHLRLLPGEDERVARLAAAQKKSKGDIIRRAVVFYLEHLEAEELDRQESKLEARIRKMEDRLAGLLARGNIDIGVVLEIIYMNMPQEDKEEVLKKCQKRSALRLKRKIAAVQDVRDLYKHEIVKAEQEEVDEVSGASGGSSGGGSDRAR